MTFLPHAVRSLLRGGVFIIAFAAVWGCSDGAAPGSTPTPTDSGPAISPVASGTVIDLALAERLYYEGDFEGALAIYSAAIENGDEGERQAGLWAIAQIQAGDGENDDAERNLRLLREMSPDTKTDRQALLLLASVEFAQADLDEGRAAFEAYLESGGPAASYAHLGLADIESAEGNAEAALSRIVEALAAGLPASAEAEAIFTQAALYEAEEDYDSASAALSGLTDSSRSDATAAEALWRRGNLEASRGDENEARLMYRTLIRRYPEFARALDALNTPLAAADPGVSSFDRAFVYFVQRSNDLALAAFEGILASPATGTVAAAEAHYYLGILSERFSLYDEALAHYDAAIALLSPGLDDPLRGQSAWDRATVLELQGDIDGAIAGFAEVGEIPGAELAGEGTFRAGLLAYNLGRVSEAITHWTRFSQVAASGDERARAHYWLGLAHQGFDSTRAGEEFAAAAAADPLGYYGLVAAATIDPTFCCLNGDPPGNAADVESWLRSHVGPEDATARNEFFAGDPWRRARELHEASLSGRADDEFREMLEGVSGDAWLLYRFAEETSELGLPWISTLAAQRLALRYADPPPALLRLVYPREYWDLVQVEAEVNGFDPYLLLSMMRQESLYFPRAVSPAEALGLTQVIPATADGIAAAIGEEDFTYIDLFRPNVSIRFGSYYVGTQLDVFGGNVRAAVAAYNGGPFNAETWLAAAGGDNDIFVEAITFTETRSYVELVLENYALYRYAWGETSRPALSP
ncbi:MAG: transglycosylase SLT domain-containing protein [Chloroflexi bacterium]|nr:transglycosylase SLT domain-containing protein [Chloroflexota bacterium]MCI0842166.1 transglycosylase SLT domain-containing protein [Chloroflexota bacterium]MCI0884796.1 transglycosylase SLT domain-containing protein [Chloroflexota bacterium]